MKGCGGAAGQLTSPRILTHALSIADTQNLSREREIDLATWGVSEHRGPVLGVPIRLVLLGGFCNSIGASLVVGGWPYIHYGRCLLYASSLCMLTADRSLSKRSSCTRPEDSH